jgi:hypothetical protein
VVVAIKIFVKIKKLVTSFEILVGVLGFF